MSVCPVSPGAWALHTPCHPTMPLALGFACADADVFSKNSPSDSDVPIVLWGGRHMRALGCAATR